MKYASQTEVSSEKSQAEIRKILSRYGATKFAYIEEEGRAAVMFEMRNRRIRFLLPLPSRTAREILYTPGCGLRRSVQQQHEAYEQAIRQRWRALALAIKAKLEAVESGISEFEEEFLSFILLPNGQTVGEFVRPQVETTYLNGTMPKLLPGIGETGPVN